MRKIMNGLLYDTDTAECYYTGYNEELESDIALYVTPKKRYFVMHDNDLKLVDGRGELKNFVEQFCDIATYERIFGKIEEA